MNEQTRKFKAPLAAAELGGEQMRAEKKRGAKEDRSHSTIVNIFV